MEHALCGCHWNLPPHFNVDRKINFSGNCWTLHINNSHCFYSFNTSAFLDDVDEIFSLSWLADQDDSLVWGDIIAE